MTTSSSASITALPDPQGGNNAPHSIVLNSEYYMAEFYKQAMKMSVADYDIEDIINNFFQVIRFKPDAVRNYTNVALQYNAWGSVSDNDGDILAYAVKNLYDAVYNELNRMGAWDSRGTLYYLFNRLQVHKWIIVTHYLCEEHFEY